MTKRVHALVCYFASLSNTRLILWCYLIWYLTIVFRFFDTNLALWMSCLGISAIMGFAFVLATAAGAQQRDPWQTFRLFFMPFCSSSFSALIKGHGFVVIFPPELLSNLIPLALIAIFCAGVLLLRHRRSDSSVRSQPDPADLQRAKVPG